MAKKHKRLSKIEAEFLDFKAKKNEKDRNTARYYLTSEQWVQNNLKKGRRGFVIEQFKGIENIIKTYFIK